MASTCCFSSRDRTSPVSRTTSYGGQQSVRFGDWKAVRQNLVPAGKQVSERGEIELYNLKQDVSEKTNVAQEHPDIVATAKKLMAEQHEPSELFPFPALDRSR